MGKTDMLLLLLLSRFSRVQLCATPQTAAQQAPRPWDSPGKNTGVGCHFLLQCMKVKSESEVSKLSTQFTRKNRTVKTHPKRQNRTEVMRRNGKYVSWRFKDSSPQQLVGGSLMALWVVGVSELGRNSIGSHRQTSNWPKGQYRKKAKGHWRNSEEPQCLAWKFGT